jgi:OOP family OmpA-OmpF porin
MRLRAILFAVVVLAGAGAAAYRLGGIATGWVERDAAAELATAFDAAGQDWVEVAVDGLTVTLAGAAPDETSRFRALEIARQVVAERRITDTTTIAAAEPLAPPPFALELLRNDAEISLIGLVPETGGRDVIRAALGAGGIDENVTDMLESAAEPAPEGWSEALGFGLAVLGELPRAKISVAPGAVSIIAVADSDPERGALEAGLRRAAPASLDLTLEISAPRPVIAPFAFDFGLRDGTAWLDACSADSEEAAAAILAAARAAGLAGAADCAVGLGAPSPDWAAAVARGLDAIGKLGGGRFTLSDLTAELTAPEDTGAEALASVSTALDAALPDVFQLTTVMPPRMETGADGARVYAPRFDARLDENGDLRLSGPVQDAASQTAIASFAAALFGHAHVINATVVDPALPEGWPGRVLAGVEALSGLSEGRLTVTPDAVALEGSSIDPHAADRVEALLAAKIGQTGAIVNVAYDAAAAAAAELAARPRPEICAEQIGAILQAGSIQFARGSADIVPESQGVIAAIADELRGCPGADFVIAGHTDSQGPAESNQRLSEERAQAVLAALLAEDLPLVHLSARGYGADSPVGDNTTESGRASNRRIEFTLAPPPGSPEAIADAAAVAAVAPSEAEECAAEIGAILAADSIQFAAGSATIAPESEGVILQIAGVLAGCPDAAFEIGGHTDSQGSEAGNLRLSEERARAVLAALRSDELPLLAASARGYGETAPVADNATAEGRAENRRIAFTLAEGAGEVAAAPTAPPPAADDATALCSARIDAILTENSIEFAAGSAEIAPESASIVSALAGVLRGCPDAAFEVAGYTDSSGSEAGNLRISEERAAAVMAAVRRSDLPLPGLTARGYGEADPIADNGTAEGRSLNRRIAFLSVAPDDVGEGDGSQ